MSIGRYTYTLTVTSLEYTNTHAHSYNEHVVTSLNPRTTRTQQCLGDLNLCLFNQIFLDPCFYMTKHRLKWLSQSVTKRSGSIRAWKQSVISDARENHMPLSHCLKVGNDSIPCFCHLVYCLCWLLLTVFHVEQCEDTRLACAQVSHARTTMWNGWNLHARDFVCWLNWAIVTCCSQLKILT